MTVESQYRRPSTPEEVFKQCSKAWRDDMCLVITKFQQAKLSKSEFEVIEAIGNRIYGKGMK